MRAQRPHRGAGAGTRSHRLCFRRPRPSAGGANAAFIVGLITAVFGSRPGMISGATVVLMGVLQITFGLLKLGKFIRMVPFPVMIGFVNGLAIVIFWRSSAI